MKTVYSQQALVRVWRNMKTYGNVPTSHFGHASVTIKGTTVIGRRVGGMFNKTTHISFWPGEGGVDRIGALRSQPGSISDTNKEDRRSEMNKLTAIRLEVGYCQTNKMAYPPVWDLVLASEQKGPLTEPRPGQKSLMDDDIGRAHTRAHLDDDGKPVLVNGMPLVIPLYSQSPDVKVYLPGLWTEGRFWGLHLEKMEMWWDNFLKSGPQYKAFGYQNCAGVVLEALRAGGAEAIAECPTVRTYTEPRQVEAYAQALSVQLERLESWALGLESDIELNRKPVPVYGFKDGLWTVEAWKGASALGLFSTRSQGIQEIDQALADFQRYSWSLDFVKRYRALGQLFMAVIKHRSHKSQSERTPAVTQLGSQILEVLRHRRFNAH